MIKQAESIIPQVRTDGCLLLCLLSFSEGERTFSHGDVSRAFRYLTPHYMLDGEHVRQDRCYILNHEEVIRCGFYLMGNPDGRVEYAYRKDGDNFVIGDESALDKCTHFVKKVKIPEGYHFIRTNCRWMTTFNPGESEGEIVSWRGYILW